jgi:hypothetical protein
MSTSETHNDKRDASTAELVKDLTREVSQLVRQEMQLAKAEMTEKANEAKPAAEMFSAAAVLGLATVGGSMAFFILLLDIAMPAWLAALIVTVVYGAVAGILALSGKERMSRATPPTPQRTIESVKEDVQWAKSHATSNSK